jgi:hypothetical protein
VQDLLVVDCLLPGQIRQLGQRTTYVSARRPIKATARDCRIRGGEYATFDRASMQTALGVWLPAARAGDAEAASIVGEIFERGLGGTPDYTAAAEWYRRAADLGSTRAQIDLGHLYEKGLGVSRDLTAAIRWYRRAAGLATSIELNVAPAPVAVPIDSPAVQELRRKVARLQSELDERTASLAQKESALREREGAAAVQESELTRVRTEVQRLQSEIASQRDKLAELSRPPPPAPAPAPPVPIAGPEISIIQPQLLATRGVKLVAAAAAGTAADQEIIGRVAAPAGLLRVLVNEQMVQPNELGVFTARLTLGPDKTPVHVAAIDRQGKRSDVEFVLRSERASAPAATVSRASDPLAGIEFGRYHALLIGNNEYRHLPDLKSAASDATQLAEVLERRYGFRTKVLIDADRYAILSALNALREQLTAEDNLLIYYAGHGELDEANNRGYWLPVDAEPDSNANWIASVAITDILNIMKARQVLLVADSCYAGALTRSSVGRMPTGTTEQERRRWLEAMTKKRARTVLTSGGLSPVLDVGGGGHSVFAKAMLEVLSGNTELLDGQRLYREVAARVSYAAGEIGFDQVPEYAPIRYAGHEAGEFFFVPRH